jgi:hypothetical protein
VTNRAILSVPGQRLVEVRETLWQRRRGSLTSAPSVGVRALRLGVVPQLPDRGAEIGLANGAFSGRPAVVK